MPELKQDPRLSILIPTFNRYGRLYRGLVYLDGISRLPQHQKLFKSIEIIIADGTIPSRGQSSTNSALLRGISSIVDKLNQKTSIEFASHPGVGLLERFSWLSAQARGDYVTMLGDEDLLVFDSISSWLDELDIRHDYVAIAGQYLNIKGYKYRGLRLKILMEEGLVNGVDVDADDVKNRLIQWTALGSNGIPSISYSLMRRDVFSSFGRCLDNVSQDLTYCGAEYILNLLMLGAGKVSIKNLPYVVRDYTFLDHTSSHDSSWSDDSQEKKIWREGFFHLNNLYSCFSNPAELEEFVDWLTSFSSFGVQGRFALLRTLSSCQVTLGRQLWKNLSLPSRRQVANAWRSTAELCYNKKDLKIIGLPAFFFKSFVGRLIYSLLSMFRV